MRRKLELCVEMDDLARSAYRRLASSCDDPAIADVLLRLAEDEGEHITWWRELIDAWDQGLLPDIWPDTDAVYDDMEEIVSAMRAASPAEGVHVSADEALTIAVDMEFFMLDPMFGELLDLAEPGVSRARHDSYARHIDRLIEAVERHYQGRTLAGFLARVLRRSWRENRSLAHFAMRDPLTGLSNRRSLAVHLSQWSAWSARYGRPLTLVLADLDKFKDVNDLYGHLIGDEVLRRVSSALQAMLRASDKAARYGGDEFAIIAPETGPEEARALCDRVVAAVHDLEIPVSAGGIVKPTVSVGAAILLEPADSDLRDPDELLAAADHGLYAAKRAGRDRASDPTVLLAPIL